MRTIAIDDPVAQVFVSLSVIRQMTTAASKWRHDGAT